MIVAPTLDEVRAVDRRVALVFDQACRSDRRRLLDVERRMPWATPDDVLRAVSVSVSVSVPCVAALGAPQDTPLSKFGALLKFWTRSDLGITLVGSDVSVWADQSASDFDVSGAARPVYSASDVNSNGRPSLTFDPAASDTLSSAAFGTPIAQPCTWLVVARNTETTALQRHIIDGVGAGRHVIYRAAGGTIDVFAGAVLSSGVQWGTTTKIVIVELNGASSAIYVNAYTTASVSGNAGSGSLTGIQVSGFGAGNFWKGTSMELACVSGAPALATRQWLATYASSLYGVAVS